MEGLPPKIKETLLNFRDTPYFEAYQEYVILEAGKCLGMFRNPNMDHDQNMYWKGVMHGLEKLWLDMLSERVALGEEEKANHDNRGYTKKLIEEDLKKRKK